MSQVAGTTGFVADASRQTGAEIVRHLTAAGVVNKFRGKPNAVRRFEPQPMAQRQSGYRLPRPRQFAPTSRLERLWADGLAMAAMAALASIVVFEVLQNSI